MPISDTLEDFKVEEWDKPKVLKIFKELNFNRYIDRFSLKGEEIAKQAEIKELYKITDKKRADVIKLIKEQKQLIFYIKTERENNPEKIIKENISRNKYI